MLNQNICKISPTASSTIANFRGPDVNRSKVWHRHHSLNRRGRASDWENFWPRGRLSAFSFEGELLQGRLLTGGLLVVPHFTFAHLCINICLAPKKSVAENCPKLFYSKQRSNWTRSALYQQPANNVVTRSHQFPGKFSQKKVDNRGS